MYPKEYPSIVPLCLSMAYNALYKIPAHFSNHSSPQSRLQQFQIPPRFQNKSCLFLFLHMKLINDDILKPTILIQYLNNKLFNIKAEGTATMWQIQLYP